MGSNPILSAIPLREHRLTLVQVTSFLADNDRAFLGFDHVAQARYRSRFAGEATMIELACRQAFADENPEAVVAIYQFRGQKNARAARL